MSMAENEEEVNRVLREWYGKHKRDLPWRNTKDPYIIWISEVILQQTRVAQGMDYFLRFTQRFPAVGELAAAEEDEVLKYWQGLGYYSRARNIHAAAKMVMDKYKGVFPMEHDALLSLKGIGEYTAAAIVSFTRNQPYPVLDGNVFRVLSRLYGLDTPVDTGKGKKEFYSLAGMVMDPEHAGDHNQAIMEFGALQCIPKNPDCPVCPLQEKCVAYNQNRVDQLPVKQKKAKTRNRYFHYLFIVQDGCTWINRRSENDIWKGLYELPLIETDRPLSAGELVNQPGFIKMFGEKAVYTIRPHLTGVKHILSHQVIYADFYKVEIVSGTLPGREYLKINTADLDRFAVSRLVQLFLEKL